MTIRAAPIHLDARIDEVRLYLDKFREMASRTTRNSPHAWNNARRARCTDATVGSYVRRGVNFIRVEQPRGVDSINSPGSE